MSIGNLKTEGDKGNNFPWQYKVLLGLQAIADNTNTNQVEIIAPLGSLPVNDSVSVALASDQFTQKVTPVIIVASGVDGTIGLPTWSISFASNGTAAALVSFDEGASFVSLPAGTTINMTAGIFNWYYDTNVFQYDTTTNAGASLIITYNA